MFNSDRQEKDFSVLIVAEAEVAQSLACVLDWGTWGARCLDRCCSPEEAVDVVRRVGADVVIADFNADQPGAAALERLCSAYPGLPVVVISDAADGASLRKAFLLGAFDYIVKPVTPDTVSDLARRLKERLVRANEGGVFSPSRSELARHLLYGTPSERPLLRFEEDCQSHSWVSVLVDIVSAETPEKEIEEALDRGLRDGGALGIREFNHDRGVLRLTLLFHDRSADRAERTAAYQAQKLIGALSVAGFWSVAGIGPAVLPLDLAGSLQAAGLAAGYSLARGAGVYTYRGEQEFAGLPCPDLGHHMDQFLSRLQSGGDWTELMDPFFDALSACSSARRLHQDVQLLFSGIADLIPLSPEVEKFYHIVDFVHGPEALRAELKALCLLAGEARRVNGRSLADRKLVEFQEYIAQHYGDWQLDLAVVCSALQISPSYLSKILRRSLNLTFVEFVTEVRMARSRELLSSTDLLTSQIAEQVGYVYTHYFSAIFKKRYAVTPSEFRTWCRTRVLESVTA